MTQRRRNRHNLEQNYAYIAQQQRLRSDQKCERVHAVFTISGRAKVKEYRPRWTADRDYLIKRVRVTAGNHVPHDDADDQSHPNDGCPRGDDLIIQIFKYEVTWEEGSGDRMRIFERDNRLTVPAGKHRDTAWAADIKDDAEILLEDEWLTVRVAQVGDTYPGDNIVVTVVMEPA